MNVQEYINNQVNILPEETLVKVADFISYQKFLLGLYENETDYLLSIPGMSKKIIDGMNTPLSECVSEPGLWDDV